MSQLALTEHPCACPLLRAMPTTGFLSPFPTGFGNVLRGRKLVPAKLRFCKGDDGSTLLVTFPPLNFEAYFKVVKHIDCETEIRTGVDTNSVGITPIFLQLPLCCKNSTARSTLLCAILQGPNDDGTTCLDISRLNQKQSWDVRHMQRR